MTVQTTSTTVQFQGDGTSVSFPFGFRVLEPDHIDVFLVNNNTASAVQGIPAGQVVMLDPSKYNVTLSTNGPGGTVTFTGTPAPTSNITVTIERATPETQLTNYVPNDPFPAESHERALDKLTLIVQELGEEANNGGFISAPPGENPDCPPLPPAETRAGKFIQFNTQGCPTLTDLQDLVDEDGDLTITAPQTLSDLTNVSASSPNARDVISFNPTSGEWTPEANVFSINEVSGDITLGTNENGDIVINPGEEGEDGETTIVNAGDIGGGSSISKTFTAAENGQRGDPVALRSSAEVELVKRSETNGGAIDTSTLITVNSGPSEHAYSPKGKTHAALFRDRDDNGKWKIVLFTLDAENQVVDAIGPAQFIEEFIFGFEGSLSLVYDSVGDTFVVVARDETAGGDFSGELVGYVCKPDYNNLTLSVGAKQTSGEIASNSASIGAGYDPEQGVILIGARIESSNNAGFLAASVDAVGQTLSFGSFVSDPIGGTNGAVARRFSYSPENNAFCVAYQPETIGGQPFVLGITLNGTEIVFGNSVQLSESGSSNYGTVWDSVNKFFVALWGDRNNLFGAVISATGANLAIESQSTLSDTSPVLRHPTFDANTGTFVFVGEAPGLGAAGSSGIAALTGFVDPSGPEINLLPGGQGPSGLLTLLSPLGDADTNNRAPGVFDSDFGAVVATYRGSQSEHDFALRVTVGSTPGVTTNRDQWIGVATEDFAAGDDVTVALRGSETFVNTSTNFEPGQRLFLDDQGVVQTDGTFTFGIATKQNERVLTAAVAGSGGVASGTGASSVDEKLTFSTNITAPVDEISVPLDTSFTRFVIEMTEVQFSAGSGALAIQFSGDGGSSYFTNDYRYNQQTTPFDISEPRVDAASGQEQFQWRGGPPADDSADTAYYKIHVWGARNPDANTKIYTEGLTGDVTFEWLAGTHENATVVDQLRLFSSNPSETISRARVRVRGIE